MIEFRVYPYEERRIDYFKKKREAAKRKLEYWARPSSADRVGWMVASDRASDSADEYHFYNDVIEILEGKENAGYKDDHA